ncbi:MAG: response regulator transcription factor [Methylacidiphilales bacterium]|nr:response regulator transcription factor [Candidatus Methylacidiphilales bacterium]NJR16684.1 response regulator transcription factor [Calothrix sp. CSU_2_0]
MNRILIAEDESRIAAFIEKGLRSHGFTTAVADDGITGIDMAVSNEFDLVILDLGLPGKDGLEVLEEIRGQGVEIPVIILTARDDIQDKVVGFEAGADDYLTKPFRFEELLVRVKARLRNNNSSSQPKEETTLKAGDVFLDLRSRKVKVNGESTELPAREFTLAETFFRHPGQILSREQLLDRVWGYDYDPGSNIVDVYVGYLRKKLGNNLIETVRGMGYRLRA